MKVYLFVLAIICYFSLHYFRLQVVMVFNIRGAHAYVSRQIKNIARMIFVLAKFFVDCRVKIVRPPGVKLPEQFLLVSNHQSLLDIPVLLYAFTDFSLRFVGKKELFRYILLVSAIFRVQRHAKIDRKGNFADTVTRIERLARMCGRMGLCPVVFPEGTRSRTGVLGPFHSGAVRTILRTLPLPVVSVATDGGYRAAALRQFMTNLAHLRYDVKVLSVYPAPHSKTEIDAVIQKARTEIFEQIKSWRARSGNTVPA